MHLLARSAFLSAARRRALPPGPTLDLYFANACADMLGQDGPARRVAPTVVETADAVLVARHDVGARVRRGDRRRLVYLLDDAVFAGIGDVTLPRLYRMKLTAVECAAARRLLPRADAVVVSTPEVAAALPSRLLRGDAEIATLGPFWTGAPADGAHFDVIDPWRIGFTGAQTHAATLAFAARAAAPTLQAQEAAVFHVAAGHARPPGLPPGRTVVGTAARWSDYRLAARTRRLHLALYPLPDTAFARARSANKLIEHALLGAAPLYAAHWPRAAMAEAAGAGLALPMEPGAWAEAVAALTADPAQARALAEGAATLARRLNDPAPQRRLWARLLALPCAAPAASPSCG